MNPRDHWLHGAHITLRQVWFGKVWAAFPVTIVEDSPSRIAVYISPGAIFMAPICRREDYLRELASTDWQLCEYTWRDEPMLWSTVPGEACSLWTMWQGPDWKHAGWKVNPEARWTRTQFGFDTADYVLDAVVMPDLRSWSWKDEDELSVAVRLQVLTKDRASTVRREAQRVVGRIFGEDRAKIKELATWRPRNTWTIPSLDPTWKQI